MSLPLSATEITRLARDWPGKSKPSEHPALWHMMDVGAVAQRLLEHAPIGSTPVDTALAMLVALHDLGKVSVSFRAMLRDGAVQEKRHWEHSAALLAVHDDRLARYLGGEEETRRLLVEAIAGHHGGPRSVPDDRALARQLAGIGEMAISDAGCVIDLVATLFPGASLDGVSEKEAATLAWQVNGLTVNADWIGSDPDWFPPGPEDCPLAAYWDKTGANADRALSDAGLVPPAPGANAETRVLPAEALPHPMQQAALSCALPDGPALTVIEDATGAGKTEAALILAVRMMRAGKANGLFFALPTMATANAMLPRLGRLAQALFETTPSLALSHGRAHLSAGIRDIGANPEDGPHRSHWLADDRRRVLLADIGVGTIDQALFGVLPTRFNGLRLRALSQKVLIVDEAHSYDPYMQAQLERLLRMQARLGGSVIVMTATLPQPKKRAFITAFEHGLRPPPRPRRGKSIPAPAPLDPAFPALTLVGSETRLAAVNPAPGTQRRVAVQRLSDADAAVRLIVQAASGGAACIWIRNAVDDAITAVQALQQRGIEADLLHARFALCDRLAKEKVLQQRFGKTGRDRAGQVLVATQVAEQSLDLDFDVMVSDLAPVGALIQRAGRLWRHMGVRPAETRPVPEPVLHVLSPDPDDVQSDRWLQQVLDRGAWVYDPTVTWRSARVLFDTGQIVVPEGLRDLIGAVEGDSPLSLPEALEQASFRHEGQDIVERQMALNVLIDPTKGFDQDRMSKIWDDEQFPTRLGVPQVTLALARFEPEGLEPLATEGPDRWALSEVQVSAARFDPTVLEQSAPGIATAKQSWTKARADNTWIAVLGPGGEICDGVRYDHRLGVVWE